MVGTEPATKKYISPNDVARDLDVHPSAIVRWMRRGTLLNDGSRVCLTHLRLPGGFRTTQEWLDEFLQAVADDKAGKQVATPEAPRPRAARVAAMHAELSQAGY